MPDSLILDSLNDAQRAAVAAPAEHFLVLAGAGSGKTRVLVHRIVWLVEKEGVYPEQILAVTFTNKAAAEMRARVESLLHLPGQRLWVGTFHGMAHRLLRKHWQEAGLPQAFQVIDSDDQLRLIRRVQKNLNLDEARWPPKQAQWFINSQKELGFRPGRVPPDGDIFTETYRRVYQGYEEICRTGGLVDFSELLLLTYELWESHPDLLAHYQQRFKHILVDEFQDTNQIQYQWLKKLAGQHSKMMMVGDDDQSIYSWRGAKVEHLAQFMRDFPSAQTVRLEQNYRSTNIILSAANAVIANNQNRMGKNLWTQGQEGELVSLYAAFNDRDEARFITSQIQEWVEQGGARREIAILYRSNAQSRVLEEALIHAEIPYRIYGGLRFFDRAEIKDALAYMRLTQNRDDDGAFERVVNTPTRGIGDTSLVALRECARDSGISLWRAAETLLAENRLVSRSANAVRSFLDLINALSQASKDKALHEQMRYVLENSNLLPHYRQDRSEKGLAKVENLEELLNAAYQFTPDPEEADLSPLAGFLSRVALESGEPQADQASDAVHLMTLHSAKGLEFPLVFLSGMEEGLFPHGLSSQDPFKLEEERRLCYVGMTRAMTRLYLTYASMRHLHGNEMHQRPSRFIREIPAEFLSEAYLRTKITRPVYFTQHLTDNSDTTTQNAAGLVLGGRVRHPHFGEGVVLSFEGSGAHARVQVRFTSGAKWLVVNYAKLEPV
ncbi:MAG TPA: DNA helicase II [Gammaproteobacteria bacterium]|nr:DNA helicase II [Gammaproteobacteria bacterium]